MSEETYLVALLAEKEKLSALKSALPICSKLLEDEISKLYSSLGATVNTYSAMYLQTPEQTQKADNAVKLSKKFYIPVNTYPEYNFIGKIIGPRGNSLKRLEWETGCKILIRGAGSTRDKVKEEDKRGKPGWEHLSEPLHVVIEVEKEEPGASIALHKASEVMEKLLVPQDESQDMIKKRQLKELALIKNVSEVSTLPIPVGIPPSYPFLYSYPVQFTYPNEGILFDFIPNNEILKVNKKVRYNPY